MGTSGCKSAVVEMDGRIRASARGEYPFIHPQPGWVELDPRQVWEQIKGTLLTLAPYCHDVTGIAVSSIGEAMVILDEDDNLIANGVIYLDRRCDGMMDEVVSRIPAEDIYRITGRSPSLIHSLFRLLWFQKNRPEILQRGKKIFLFEDYINYMLCGNRGIDPGTAATTLLCNVKEHAWSHEIAERFDIPLDLFSPILQPGTALGCLRPELVREIGLPGDAVVYLGCHDQGAATLGGGALDDGEMVSGQGSSESYNLVVDQGLSILQKNRFNYEPYIKKGHYFATIGNKSHGTSIRWFAENVEKEAYEQARMAGKSIYDILNAQCASDCENLIFLPYLTNEKTGQITGGFLGVDTGTTKAKMYRALLEGLAFASKSLLGKYEKMNVSLKKLSMVGGAAKSEMLMQLKADVLKRDIDVLDNTEAGITGLAMICAVAEGKVSDYPAARNQFIRVRKTYHPGKDYTERYEVYRALASALGLL